VVVNLALNVAVNADLNRAKLDYNEQTGASALLYTAQGFLVGVWEFHAAENLSLTL
jgi:hypothetical protein